MGPEQIRAINIFYSYALPDKPLLQELEKHLAILKRQRLITTWHRQEVQPGTEWRHEINQRLNQADIILLLISPDFMASDFCFHVEMKRALERHEAGKVLVIPIILRAVYWKDSPFGGFQALPPDGRPIASSPNPHERDRAFMDVGIGIRDAIRFLHNKYDKIKSIEFRQEKHVHSNGSRFSAIKLLFLEILRKTFIKAPRTKGISLARIKAPQTTGSARSAINTLRLKSEVASLWVRRADAYSRRRDYEEALNIYNQSLLLNANDPIAYCGIGDILRNLNRYKEALVYYNQAIQLNPTDPIPYCGKGDVLRGLGHYEEALEVYEQAIRLDPDDPTVHYIACRVKQDVLEKLDRRQALEASTQASRPEPHDVNVHLAVPEELHHSKDSEVSNTNLHSSEGYNLIRSGAPAAHDVSEERSSGESQSEEDTQKLPAVKASRYNQVINLDTTDSVAYREKGDALRMLKRYEEALEAYNQAVHLNPDDPLAHHGKGEILNELGRYLEALEAYCKEDATLKKIESEGQKSD